MRTIDTLEISFDYDTIDKCDVGKPIIEFAESCGCTEVLINGKSYSIKKALSFLASHRHDGFSIDFGGFETNYGRSATSNVIQCFLQSMDGRFSQWDDFLERIQFIDIDVVIARAYNNHFDLDQNMTDIGYRRSVGLPWVHLPQMLNGLPPPLSEMIIDNTRNGARREFRSGYIEAIGPVMWLGPKFVKRMKLKRAKLSESPLLTVSKWHKGLKLVTTLDDFESEENEMARRDIRNLVFPVQPKEHVL